MTGDAPRPYTLIAELTYRCPLRCPYCSNPLDYGRHDAELDADAWLGVFREAEALGVVQLNLTGGEPLVRDDLEPLVRGARALDLYVNLITSGIPLRRERLARLRELGLDGVQLSVQDAAAAGSDRLAGVRSFDRKREVAGWVRALGMPLTLGGIALAGHLILGMNWTEALLVGAILSPTDPVFVAAILKREAIMRLPDERSRPRGTRGPGRRGTRRQFQGGGSTTCDGR